jgi:hypothetical protein
MAGTPILTNIEAAIASLIGGMTTAGGYNFNWGTANVEDLAKVDDAQGFPVGVVYLEPEETNLDDPDGMDSRAYTNEAAFRVRVVGRMEEEETSPVFEANKMLNKALDDLKKLFGTNYSLSGTADVMMYRSAVRIRKPNADIMVPSEMDVFFVVRYSQDRTTPTQYAGA